MNICHITLNVTGYAAIRCWNRFIVRWVKWPCFWDGNEKLLATNKYEMVSKSGIFSLYHEAAKW